MSAVPSIRSILLSRFCDGADLFRPDVTAPAATRGIGRCPRPPQSPEQFWEEMTGLLNAGRTTTDRPERGGRTDEHRPDTLRSRAPVSHGRRFGAGGPT